MDLDTTMISSVKSSVSPSTYHTVDQTPSSQPHIQPRWSLSYWSGQGPPRQNDKNLCCTKTLLGTCLVLHKTDERESPQEV